MTYYCVLAMIEANIPMWVVRDPLQLGNERDFAAKKICGKKISRWGQ